MSIISRPQDQEKWIYNRDQRICIEHVGASEYGHGLDTVSDSFSGHRLTQLPVQRALRTARHARPTISPTDLLVRIAAAGFLPHRPPGLRRGLRVAPPADPLLRARRHRHRRRRGGSSRRVVAWPARRRAAVPARVPRRRRLALLRDQAHGRPHTRRGLRRIHGCGCGGVRGADRRGAVCAGGAVDACAGVGCCLSSGGRACWRALQATGWGGISRLRSWGRACRLL